MPRTRPTPPPARTARGFTLIELLVVIGIIGLLVGITLVVGNQVVNGGRKSLTLETIRVLDSSLNAYIHAEGSPPPTWTDPQQPNVRYLAADARDGTGPMINGLAIYMLQASTVPDAKGILDKVPSKLVQVFNPDGTITGQPVKKMTVLDAWGHPIRYVHPAFQGSIADSAAATAPNAATPRSVDEVLGALQPPRTYAITQIRRNHVNTPPSTDPDSDGGSCVGARPYFYSAGPDGLVGWKMNGTAVEADFNKDNVYSTLPTLPSK